MAAELDVLLEWSVITWDRQQAMHLLVHGQHKGTMPDVYSIASSSNHCAAWLPGIASSGLLHVSKNTCMM